MFAVVWIEYLLEPQRARDCVIVDLIGQHRVSNGAWPRHIVVRNPNQVSDVALIQELGDGSGSEDRNVVRMWLNGSQYLACMGLASDRALDDKIAMSSKFNWAGRRRILS